MRAAILQALLTDEAVAHFAGERVYPRVGPLGGVSRELTPGAFTEDGDLLPSLVVVLGSRSRPEGGAQSADALFAQQTVQVWAITQHDYAELRTLQRAVRAALHRQRFTPVEDEDVVAWSTTLWEEDSPELVDPALALPVIVSTFTAVVRLDLSPPTIPDPEEGP